MEGESLEHIMVDAPGTTWYLIGMEVEILGI